MGAIRRYLDIRSSSGPSFVADGRRLLVTSDLTGVPQAWSVPAAGGWPAQLTGEPERAQWVSASPADPAVAVVGRDRHGDERTQLHQVDPAGGLERPLTAEPATIHRFGAFTPDGTAVVYAANRRAGADFDLYRRDLDAPGPRAVTRLSGSQRPTHVTPDGTAAVVVAARSSMDGDVLLVDLHTGGVRCLAAGGRHRPGGFTDDGRGLFVAADRGADLLAAWRIDIATGAWEQFGPAGGEVEEVVVRGGTGALTVNDAGRSRLWWFNPETLSVTGEATLPAGVASDLAVAADGGRLAFTFSGAAHPAAVWTAEAGAGTAAPLTPAATPGLDRRAFVEPVVAQVASFDGLAVPVLVYRPPGGGRGPAVLSVHGGPESQERPTFRPVYQYLLDRGIAVVAPNVRGSTGYGRVYAALDDRERRADAVGDLGAVARWAQEDGLGPLAVMGASYGGYMALSALAAFPQDFAAGVSIVGIANLVTFLERTGDYRRALREAEYGSLATDRALLTALSPLSRVADITAPLLVVHGANDPRVPVGEAEQIVEALRARGREVRYLRFEDEGHGIVRLDNRVTAYSAVAEFLERHLVSDVNRRSR